MTGVLPIKKYSSGSELNMFDEFYFPTDTIYDTFFGFTEKEVKQLCQRNQKSGGSIQYEQLAEWYNGYYTSDGKRLYNPRSINKALSQNTVKDYWTETGPGTEILGLVKNNVDAVKEEISKGVERQQHGLHRKARPELQCDAGSYVIRRHRKNGGDFIFYPLNPADTAIILELKKDDTPEHAIEQIMERKYYTRFLAFEDGKTVPKQNVLVVGMVYEKKMGLIGVW